MLSLVHGMCAISNCKLQRSDASVSKPNVPAPYSQIDFPVFKIHRQLFICLTPEFFIWITLNSQVRFSLLWSKFKCNILMNKNTAIPTRFWNNSNSIGCINPLLRGQNKIITASIISKLVKFDRFEIRIDQFFLFFIHKIVWINICLF